MLSIDFDLRVGDFDLQPTFESGDELVVLFGPSGCGKSLTLQAIAGLRTPDSGRIVLPGERIAFDAEARVNMAPQARGVGYVVQNLALFPHMTARQNIEFGLAHLPKARRSERTLALVDLLSLQGLEGRRPAQLSGGQQQRVALARALAAEPSLLLLDEPFSALDASLRGVLRRELASLQKRLGVTVVFVTHDLAEAYSLADRIVVYDAGRVLQQGSRADVLSRPTSRRVAELTEVRNIIPGQVDAYVEGVAAIRTPWFTARIRDPKAPIRGDVSICIRPEHILLVREGRESSHANDAVVAAEIIEDVPMGNTHRLYMRVEQPESREPLLLEVDVPAHPYDVIGVATKSHWNIALTSERCSLVSN